MARPHVNPKAQHHKHNHIVHTRSKLAWCGVASRFVGHEAVRTHGPEPLLQVRAICYPNTTCASFPSAKHGKKSDKRTHNASSTSRNTVVPRQPRKQENSDSIYKDLSCFYELQASPTSRTADIPCICLSNMTAHTVVVNHTFCFNRIRTAIYRNQSDCRPRNLRCLAECLG